ncbi:BhlA/UviB family holin-like peptide [Clostridium sp. UBA1652]|uniref:BhlA/UviB family holin-like peptide n=1 Tax=Clostridium sp. UBA1652 TaxID=1946348 RepID=UPI00257ECAD1|nr:BhlA/UviB family holin-like peptide [Clostridium sp. UBA1652]
MESELVKMAATQGIWAGLSLVLIFYILKNQEKRDNTQEEREKNYQNIINQLTDKLETLDSISNEIIDLKKNILNNNKN